MPHRQEVLKTLDLYNSQSAPIWARELSGPDPDIYQEFQMFINRAPNCFSRSQLDGHLTGSALIVSRDLNRILLTHHKKLGKWLQLGGHADGNPNIHETALREGEEESGLKGLSFFPWTEKWNIPKSPESNPLPFDLDLHEIPARKTEPQHIHYDFRFLLCAGENESFEVSDESNDLKWFTIEEARTVTDEPSMLRQFAKLELITKR